MKKQKAVKKNRDMTPTDIWLKPKQDRVVVRRNKQEKPKPGQVIVEVKRQKPQEGIVLAIGPKVEDRNLVGQCVLFLEWSGNDAPGPSGEEYITLAENEIICEVDVALLTRLEEEQHAARLAKELADAEAAEKTRLETLQFLKDQQEKREAAHNGAGETAEPGPLDTL